MSEDRNEAIGGPGAAAEPLDGAPSQFPLLRADLGWSRRDVRGEEVWFLKDPIHRTYYRFSGAVAFILKGLDGKTPPDTLRRDFQERTGQELDQEDLESILQQAAEAGLLLQSEAGLILQEESSAPGVSDVAGQEDSCASGAPEVAGVDAAREPAQGAAPAGECQASQATSASAPVAQEPVARESVAPGGRGCGARARARGSFLSRLLHWHVGAFDPDALLGGLEKRLCFLFTPPVFVAWAGLLFAAFAVFVSNLRVLAAEGGALIRWETLPVLLPVLLLVTVLHEFGHGITCKHFGGEVREMGFLLIYFQPALYCDISDAWMLDRRARLWSVAAGTWVQIGVWSLSVLWWRVSEPETFLHAAALVVVVVAGAGALVNLVPFLKLDGYYLLSDWLEIPNLRARAFAHLRRHLLWALGVEAGGQADAGAAPPRGGAGAGAALRGRSSAKEGPGSAAEEPLPAQGRREARLFWIYGLFSALLSGGLLLYLLLVAHGFTARHLGAECVAMLWLLFATLVSHPLGALARPVGQAWADVLRRPRLSRSLVVLIAIVAALAALFLVHWELRVSAEVRFEPLNRAVVRNEVEGIVEHVAVAESHEVREGELLFELSSRQFRAALEQAEAQLLKARAELALLERGARAEEIRNAESRAEKALTREEYARRDHEKARELYQDKIIPLQELLATEEELAVRQKEVKEARAQLDLLRAGSRPEEIERMRAEVARLESVVRLAREDLDRARVRAPISGRVVTPHLDLLLGQKVERGAALCELVDSRRLRAEVEVPEREAAEVRVGQKVKIKARGFPGRAFWGEVVSIAPAAQAASSGQRASFLPGPQSRIRVHTVVDNAEGLLKPEMTGNAKIYCGKRLLVDLLTRRLVRYLRTEFWF